MKKVQSVLFEELSKNGIGQTLLNLSAIFLYITMADEVIGLLPMPYGLSVFISFCSSVIYFAYIIGLIGCFAKNEFLPVGIVFAVKATTSFIYLFKGIFAEFAYFSSASLVNLSIYGGLAALTFIIMSKSSAPAGTVNTGGTFCTSCGTANPEGVMFCGKCGNRLS